MVRQYKKYKFAAGKMSKSVFIHRYSPGLIFLLFTVGTQPRPSKAFSGYQGRFSDCLSGLLYGCIERRRRDPRELSAVVVQEARGQTDAAARGNVDQSRVMIGTVK